MFTAHGTFRRVELSAFFPGEIRIQKKQTGVLKFRLCYEDRMSHPGVKELQFIINPKAGVVSGLLQKPENSKALLVLAHGAGAGMWHKFMNDTAAGLAKYAVATFRYQFPYMEKRIKRTRLVDYAVMGAQRLTKILGIFARLDRRDGKRGYLLHMPRIRAYLDRALAHPALSEVKLWYETFVFPHERRP